MWLVEAIGIQKEGKGRVQAGFTQRLGNLGLHVGDDTEKVIARRRQVAKEWSSELEQWVCSEQVHGDSVAVVTRSDCGAGAANYSTAISGTDALITRDADVTLATFAADCVPCLFFDHETMSIGVAHAGWRGTVKRLPGKTVDSLVQTFGAKPAAIRVALGPSIGRCCYEVDQKVKDEFHQWFPEALPLFESKGEMHYQIDLREMIQKDLLLKGVLPEHIEWIGGCTSCENNRWFSHRKEKGSAGRHAGLIRVCSRK